MENEIIEKIIENGLINVEAVYMYYNEDDTDSEGGYDNVFWHENCRFALSPYIDGYDFVDKIDVNELSEIESNHISKNLIEN